ncbi:branched-chain amino acid transporter permease [Vagococcus elongatus]|uniref:Branched-chain amino acid transporter AzlD n=1 Tax=Vagococcus elongatus TaxID=180344 RepID=A0A430B4D7_9ENTE|nr:AzlD domain-containing protein [Vagococcus elongatus]RSU15185.1 branched-chain amino acid transporter AzlD [Vagococcus elongatus]
MTLAEQIITIGMVILGTMMTRFLPFILFPDNRPTPKIVQKIGRLLPSAILAMLVVYCYRHVDVINNPTGIFDIIAGIAVVLIHLKWRNMLLSIALGTIVYMLLIQI